MRPVLRVLVLLLAFFNFHAAFAQGGVDTIFGCDEIPPTPAAGVSCTICNFQQLYGTTTPFTASDPAGWCGTIENDQYIGFVAGPSGAVTFEIQTFNCMNGQGVQVGIYDQDNSLVGDCFNQVFPGTPQVFTGGGLTPGEVYYMRIDGFSGDNCEFLITVISGLISAGPDAPGPIMGLEQVCWDDSYTYFVDPVNNATGYYWEVEFGPWTSGVTVDPPEALNFQEGTETPSISLEIPEIPLAMPAGTCDTITLTVRPLNPCFTSEDSSRFSLRVCKPQQDTTYAEVCPGGEYEFPVGSGEFYSTPYTFTTIELPPGPSGCDTFGVLYLEQATSSVSDSIYPIVLCPGEVFDECGFPDPSIGAGPTSCLIEATQPGECDSLALFFVTILDPVANIEAANGTISCINTTDELFAVTRTGGIPPSSSGDSVSYAWTGPGGFTGSGESVTVDEPGTYTLEVTMTTDLDPSKSCTATATFEVTDTRTAPNPPSVAGQFTVCADEVPQTYTASGASGSDQYYWTTTPATGATVSTNGDMLTVTDFGGLASLTVCAQTFNACDTSTAACEVITINPLPTAATLTGPTELCEGATGTFAIGGYDASLTYTVSGTPAGATATVNGGNVDFTMGTASGDVCIEVSNSCATLPQVCATVALLPEPVATAPTGADDVCVGAEEVYTVYGSLPAGTTAAVTVTGGNVVVDNGGTITVEWTTPGMQTVCVTYTNSCGDSDPACLDVDVSSAGSAIMTGGGTYCAGSNNTTVTIDFVGAGPYAYTYTLDGVTQTGTATTSPVTISPAAPGEYVLTGFSVGSCDGTVSGVATVTEESVPTATLSGGGQICSGSDTTLVIDFTGDAPWTFEVAEDGTGQGTQTTSDNPFVLTVSNAGTYTLLSVESDNGCAGTVSGSADITVATPITLGAPTPTCDGVGETYTITFPVSGGDPATYTVTPPGSGTISGGVFTSTAIDSGEPYVFAISDARGCSPVAVNGDHTCPCLTMIGTLSTTAIELCGDQTPADVAAGYDASGEFQDDNDTRVYILHTGAGDEIAGAIATNTTGSFPFDPATMDYGTTYYVSVAVGNEQGGSVDLDDDCTLVAPGTPVVFFEAPEATLVGGGDICVGADTTMLVNFMGAAPWTIEYTVGGDVFTATTSDNPYTLDLIGLTDNTTVELTSVTSGACPGVATGSATINVRTGVQVTATEACNSTSTAYVVTIEISGGDPGSYTVTPLAGGTLTGGTFTSAPIPAGDGYTFVIDDQYGCDPQVVAKSSVPCDCISDAGELPLDPITVCGDLDVTVVVPVDTAMDADDIQNFVLHDGSSNAIGATVYAQQTSRTFAFEPPLEYGQTYYISAVMGNNVGGATDLDDVCLDVSVGTPVQWLREPVVTLTGDQDVCTDDPVTLQFDVQSDGPVSVTYTNGTTTSTLSLNPGVTDVPGELNESGTYEITAVSAAGCDGQFSGTAVVTVHEPVSATLVPECNSTATMYTLEITVNGGDPSSYTVTPNTGSFSGNVYTTGAYDADESYVITVTDQWGCDPVVLTGDVDCDCLTRIGTISDDFVSCDQSEAATFDYDAAGEFLDGDDAVEYLFHTGDPTMPLLRSTTASFTFDAATMTPGVTYFVTAVAGNFDGTQVDLADACTVLSNTVEVVWGDPPVVTLSGDATECPGVALDLTFEVAGPGDITIVYTDGTTQFVEVLPAGTNTVPVPQTDAATYSIVSVESAACPGTGSGTATIELLDGPAVQQPVQVTINPTGTQYTVTLSISGGDAATYTVNGTALNGATTWTSGDIDCGTPFDYTVDDAGGCAPITGTVDPDCNCLSAVGTLGGAFESCDDTELASFTYDAAGENLDGDDALQFVLYLGDLSGELARSATPEFGFDAATMTLGTTYEIVAVVGNATAGEVDFTDACLAVSAPATATWYETPGASFTGPTALCAGDDLELAFSVTGSPSGKTVYFTIDGRLDSLTNVAPGTPALFSAAASGNVTVVLTGVADANCAATLNETLTVAVASEIILSALQESCNPTNTEYTVSFEISGGDAATYEVLPAGAGTITGANPAVFTSNPIASGDLYTFTVRDASGCFQPQVSDDPRCDCETDAGTMTLLDEVSVCAGEDIVVDFDAGSETLDPNDVLRFALRTDNDVLDYTDDVLATSDTPTFSSLGLTPGQTYYVSPIAGDGTGAGDVDTGDDCLDIGLATPVFIQALPDATLTGDTVICETGTATITVVLVGNGPFDVTINEGDAGSDTTITGIDDGYTFEVDPATGTVYFITEVTDSSIPQCQSAPSSNVTVDVEDLLTAGVAGEPLDICEGTGDVIVLDDQLTDGDLGGTWTQTSGPAAGANFDAGAATITNATLDPGTYEFTYTVGSGAPCPTDSESITVDIEAGPTADAGPDQELTCDEPQVELGGDVVAGYTYAWSGGSVADPTSALTTTTVAGTYVLTVTSGDAECRGVDEVVVASNDDIPVFDDLLTRDVTCFGDTDGAIFTGVRGGTGPFTYTLDGETNSNVGQFTNVSPGEHELQVVDSEGCVYVDTIVVEDAKEVVVDAGPNAEIRFGDSHEVQLYLEGDVESVRWEGDSLQCISTGPLCDRALLWPEVSGTYAVTVRDSNGCAAEDVIQLIVRRDRPVFVPTAFSPNGDGVNDHVFVRAREGVLRSVNTFMIFDRWGEVMFKQGVVQPNDASGGWDGRFRDETLNPAVFTYWCEVEYIDGETEILKGDITLVAN